MKNQKHTPGPWKLSIETEGKIHQYVVRTDEKPGFIGFEIARTNPCNIVKREHDARLIAAAPELLELLEKINMAFYTRTTRKAWLDLMEQSKPLIRKAKGDRT